MNYVVVVLGPVPGDMSGVTSFVAQRFKIPEERAAQLLKRVPGPVTKAVPEAQARTVAAILAEAGLDVELREGGPEGPAVPFAAPVPVVPAAGPAVTDPGVAAATPAREVRSTRVEEPAPAATGVGEEPAPTATAVREEPADEVEEHDEAPSEFETPVESTSVRESRGEGSARSTHAPPAGTTTTTPPRDPTRTTLVREPPDVDRRGLRRRIATAATLPAVLTLLAALVVLTATLLPALRAQQLERAQSTATAVARTIEGLSGGLPLSSPLIRTQLAGVRDRAAGQLSAQGVSFMAVVEPDGNVLLGWEGGGGALGPEAAALVDAAARGRLPAQDDSLLASLRTTWETLLTVVGLRPVEPVVAAAGMERAGSPLGVVVVGVDPSGLRQELGRVLLTALLVGLVPVLFSVLAALSLTRGITDAVRYLLVATDRISHGDFEQPVELKRDDELGQIARAVERMRISLREGMERLRRRR